VSLFADHWVVVRGGGDLATGVVARLHRAGFPLVVLELATPLAIRRTVSVARAVREGTAVVEDLTARLVDTPAAALNLGASGLIPVLVSDRLPVFPEPVSVLVDARLAKSSLDTSIDQAPLVVALGPGLEAGIDCHAVVETMRGHRLGRVLWSGSAAANTGVPGLVGGRSVERVVRSTRAGPISWNVDIGDLVAAGQTLGTVAGEPIPAGLDGVVRGLIDSTQPARPGLKIADIDPRTDPAACFEISDKALSVGGGVLEAILVWLNGNLPE
jgi:xanthine dehydrogenase accessory factor